MDENYQGTPPVSGGDGSYSCTCPNCGKEMKLTLAKAEPKPMAKPAGMPSMSEPAPATEDTASMLEKAY